VKHTMRDRFCH